jgi:hypothetical protein
MKAFMFGYDRRVRICLRCHSWFLAEGAHMRLCAPCSAEAETAVEFPWQSQQLNQSSRPNLTVAAGKEVSEVVA